MITTARQLKNLIRNLSRKYLDLPSGIPTDDTFRIVIGNMDAGHFFDVTVGFLINIVDKMLAFSGKSGDTQETGIIIIF